MLLIIFKQFYYTHREKKKEMKYVCVIKLFDVQMIGV